MGRISTLAHRGHRSAHKDLENSRRRIPGIVDIERLGNRQLLSYASTILSDLYATAGNAWTYQEVNSASTVVASETFLAKGNTTFDGHNVFQLQTNIGTTTSTASENVTLNDYFATTSDGLIDYGTTDTATLVSSATTTTTSSLTTISHHRQSRWYEEGP